MAPITDCIRKGEFSWTKSAAKSFDEIKIKMTEAPVLYASLIFQRHLKFHVMLQERALAEFLVKRGILLLSLVKN